MFRKAIRLIVVPPLVVLAVTFAIIGLNDVVQGSYAHVSAVSETKDPPANWREEELQQAASIRAYGRIIISAQACGLRSEDWAWQLVSRVNAATKGRPDLSEEFEHAKNVTPDHDADPRECEAIASLLPNADHVIEGSQAIFDPVYFTTVGDGRTYKP